MQEEVEQKSLTLTVNAAKMTARLFRAAIAKYVAHRKEKKHDAQTGVDVPVTPMMRFGAASVICGMAIFVLRAIKKRGMRSID